MNKLIPLIVLISAFYLKGCNNVSEPDVVYVIQNVDAGLEDVEIFIRCMSEFPASFSSEIEFDLDVRELRFKNGSPDERVVTLMAENNGQLLVYSDDKLDPWVTTEDVAQASARAIDGRDFVYLFLTEKGAARMSERSGNHIGKKVYVELDGTVLMALKINDQLGSQFLFSTDSINVHPVWVSVLISYGSMKPSLDLKKK